jgi:hypothetical protein
VPAAGGAGPGQFHSNVLVLLLAAPRPSFSGFCDVEEKGFFTRGVGGGKALSSFGHTGSAL